MAQLTRKLLKLFCGNKEQTPTNYIGIFGSKKAGSSAWSSDPDSIQSTHYSNGWSDATVSSQAPCMDDMNAIQYLYSYMIKYLYQNGIPEWLATEEYYTGALVRYSGSLWVSIYATANTGNTPSDISAYWRKYAIPFSWVAGNGYSVGDLVLRNGGSYRCVVAHTSQTIFENDFYAGYWDDGLLAGSLRHSIAWNKSTLPYHYFDVTGADAGKEVSKTTYANLYAILGDNYNNCYNFTSSSQYANPSSGNFRLPDFRNSFMKTSGSKNWATGHNASHTHTHNRGSAISLNHNHELNGYTPYQSGSLTDNYYQPYYTGASTSSKVWCVRSSVSSGYANYTRVTGLSVPALTIYSQGSGSVPEPNYYGVKILLKY